MRIGILLAFALAAVPSVAQTTSTQCRWIGSIWSCDTSPSGVTPRAPLDPGAILKSGAALVPNYAEQEARKKQLELQERELRLREREIETREKRALPVSPPPYGASGDQADTVSAVLAQCRADYRAMIDGDMKRQGSPLFNGNGLEAGPQALHRMICSAYSSGLADGLRAANP